MHSKIGKTESLKSTYPYLGISEEYGRVVLFTSPKTGTCLCDPQHRTDFETCSAWAEEDFILFDKEITLSND